MTRLEKSEPRRQADSDSGRRRPASYEKDEELEITLPEENYAPTQGPLGERQQREKENAQRD